MKVVEIFTSIDGEGIRAGLPCVFVRFAGCNLRCSYCDTPYAQDCKKSKSIEMSPKEIVRKVLDSGFKRVTLTGGEPLLQEDIYELITQLYFEDIEVNVETNGSIPFERSRLDITYNTSDVICTIDYKSPSSGMNSEMCPEAFDSEHLKQWDVLKFVVGSHEDLEEALRVINAYEPKCNIFFSPVFGKIEPAEIVDFIKAHYLRNCRVQLQLHKFIWDPNKRGV